MDFPDRDDVTGLLEPRPLPSFARVRYEPETDALGDPASSTRSELDRLALDELVAGATVAVGVGSRGIHAIDGIVTEVVSELDERGFEPVIVPAMGSHGGATPEGQREILETLGIMEANVGAPIDARMDAERVTGVEVRGTRTPVYVASAALEADAVLVVNRVKPHTNFSGRLESGLCKMIAVGIGKQQGAGAFHSMAIRQGYVPTIETLVDTIRESRRPGRFRPRPPRRRRGTAQGGPHGRGAPRSTPRTRSSPCR